ncbi:PRK06851 family protein [Haloimpatiens sp. FM7330]|uniref:PRK06851 family protein n=1 Tax=Haloimpatiens sp. FM7330 TaxID=3298610 RepID=UPI003631AACF
MKGHIRHLFPGGNTSKGFYSFYKYILPQKDARKIICIKGGPGTGKSSIIKTIGEYFNEKGYNIEFHHCSSDNNSLDGVVIRGLNIALLDGTSPHVVDPKNPGAVDEILNLGQFWNEEGFKANKSKIINLNNCISETFQRAYKYISASKIIHDSWSKLNSEAVNISKLNHLKENLKNEIFKTDISEAGTDRHLFATAFTPNGIITYIDNLYSEYKTIYALQGEPGTHKSDILEYLSCEALKRGHYVEIFHHPLIPEQIEHVLIPDLSIAILTSNELNKKVFPGIQIQLNELQTKEILTKNNSKIQEEKEMFYLLLNKGLNIISQAKKLHDELETYYIPNMNFDELNVVLENLISKLTKYENSTKIEDTFNQSKKGLYFI